MAPSFRFFFSRLAAAAASALVPVAAFAAAAPLLAGCSLQDADEGSDFNSGQLGQAKFAYTCIDATDPACAGTATFDDALAPADGGDVESSEINASGADAPTYPLAIAVGSTFRLTYGGATENAVDPSENVGAALFKTVTDSYLEPIGSGPSDFRALAPGYAGVYIESTVDSELIDYTLVHVVNVQSLSIGDAKLTPFGSSFALTSSSASVFTVTPLYEQTAVAGALDLEWSVDDPTLVALTTSNPTARMTVAPLLKGTTTLHVTGAGKSASITLEVSP